MSTPKKVYYTGAKYALAYSQHDYRSYSVWRTPDTTYVDLSHKSGPQDGVLVAKTYLSDTGWKLHHV